MKFNKYNAKCGGRGDGMGMLEQGKCSQNLGQQAVVHRAARRTFESKCCRCSSAQLLRTPPPETHRASSFVPQMRRIMMWTVLGAHSTHSTTTTKIIWAAESKAPRPLEQHWTRRVSEPVRRLPFWVGTNMTETEKSAVGVGSARFQRPEDAAMPLLIAGRTHWLALSAARAPYHALGRLDRSWTCKNGAVVQSEADHDVTMEELRRRKGEE